MKAILLSAGRGARLRPLTDHTAKPLVQAAGRSLIEYHLDNLARAGIRDIVINTCWMADKIVDQLGDGSNYGVQIQYSHEIKALETAGGIARALPLLGDGFFIVISADIWCDFPLAALTIPDRGLLAHLIMVANPDHNVTGDFDLQQNTLVRGSSNAAGLTYTGIGVYHTSLFEHLRTDRVPLREILDSAIDNSVISGTLHQGAWFDVGTPERLSQLESYLNSKAQVRG